MRARLLVACLAALLTTCTPGPAPAKEPRIHPEFPITEGATHALGKVTPLDGEVKCQSCHLLTQTNFAQFECTGCHRHAEDVALADHSRAGLVDGYTWSARACYGCHGNGVASRIRHDPARDFWVTSLEPTWAGNVITAVTLVDAGLPMEMNHLATTLACATCHPNAELGSFYPGQFHGTLDALDAGQPAACSVCHVRGAPSGFVGALQLTRDPPTGRMRHDLDAGLGADCGACHTPPSRLSDAGWTATAAFHATVRPTACLECHANTRPGVLDSTNAALPQGRRFNHQADVWLGECSDCHAGFQTWADGGFHHLPEFRRRPSCLPCHDGERPADSGIVKDPPFDFDTNARGVRHGAGQDCVLCHAASTQRFDAGFFGHDAGVVVTQTCVACHTTQRPGVAVNGFLHSVAGTGDCFGCHQASTSTPRSSLGDWAGGQRYPAGNLIGSSDRFTTVTQTQLLRNDAGLVTATAVTQATLYNAMLHTSQFALDAGPAPGDPNTCSLCHLGSPAGSLNITTQGVFHTSVPSQPTACLDCHVNMRPAGIVQRTNLRPMDHSLVQADCSLCHSLPGGGWSDGVLHARVDAGSSDCTSCHYTLMADSAAADVISTASPGPKYQMRHRSNQLTFQRCDRCHTAALASAPGSAVASQWRPGVMHASLSTQPTACADCHRPVSVPPAATTSSGGFGMNHQAAFVAARDCAFCHAADATASTWSKATKLHIAGITPPGCSLCHANNVPAGLHDTDVVTSASPATGVSGQKVKIAHSDVNVSTRDCGFCHLQAGTSFSGAQFHARFTGAATLTGRCSSCHFNLRPTSAFTAHDHSAYAETTGTDCSACHTWPGPNGAASPSWHSSSGGGAGSAPALMTVGAFTVASPPAPNTSTTQAGLNGLAHPAIPAGGSCMTCHTMASGGRNAFAYDHALAPATGCAACHEAGSNLIATPWTLNAPGAVMVAAQCTFGSGQIFDRGGDTRPIGIAAIACMPSGKNTSNHFYPADCGECHRKPAAVPAVNTTGSAFATAWRFVHSFGAPVQSSTCSMCH